MKQGILFLFSVIALFLLSTLSKYVFVLAAFFTLLISFFDIHIYHHWGDTRLGPRLQTALLSPTYEMKEYLQNYFDVVDVLDIVYLMLGVFLLAHFFRKHHNSLKALKITGLVVLLATFMALNVAVDPIERVAPYRLIPIVLKAEEWKGIVDKRMEYLEKRTPKYKNLTTPYDKIVIVVGESASRHHMHAFGYQRETTPFFDRLKGEKYSCFLENIISPANATRYAIPLELTEASVGHFYDFLMSESLVSVFKDLGYRTYWLSNQSRVGQHETFVTSIAVEADITEIANSFYTDQTTERSKPDIVLLDMLKRHEPNDTTKEAYFFHLMGSHALYSRRYDKRHSLIENPKTLLDHYDNSIYYTDYILERIFSAFKGKGNLLFVYISDHAERFADDRNGHGSEKGYKTEFDIPLVIYSSMDNERLQKVCALAKNQILNMESFNYLIKYLIGVEHNLSKISQKNKVMTLSPTDIHSYSKMKY